MNLSSTTKDNALVVTVDESRIDAAVALKFKEAMRTMTEDVSGTVVLDLGQVEFVDSSGLGAIVATMKALGSDRKLVLAGLTPAVEKVFRLTRMDSIFDLFDRLEDALDHLNT